MGEAMALYASFGTPTFGTSVSSPSSLSFNPVVFSVPPPPAVGTQLGPTSSCAACRSCGSRIQLAVRGNAIAPAPSAEERTFALQLRAAAVFNKTDVPPPVPPSGERLLPLNVPPPPPPAPAYPPPLDQLPSFTRFPPPITPFASALHDAHGDADPPPTPSVPFCDTTSSSPSGMKRMSDMGAEESPVKRARPAGDTELRLLIQSKHSSTGANSRSESSPVEEFEEAAGSIIGKGGQNISRLRSENPASITVPDCPGPERVLTIGGSEEVAMKVLEEVLESLDEAQPKDGGDSDVRILVHHSQAGCIIGKGGSKIKELRELCGGQVKVYTNCCPQSSDRVIQILGDRQRVLLTVGNILESLRESPIKGINNPYNPHNFDEFYAQEYGGWSEGPKGRFPPMGRGPPPMGPGGPISRGPMGPGGPLGPPGPPPFNRRGPPFPSRGGSIPSSMHSPNSDYDGMRQGKPFMNGGSPHNGDHNTTTQQVTIPKEAAGAIIGKGGARIRKIRADSGASISIEDSRPGSNDRIITITGSDTQIKHAQYLLQQSVREFGGQSVTGSRRF